MRRWLYLSAAMMILALGLLFGSVGMTEAQDPRPAATPTPARPIPIQPPVRVEPLPIGGQTIGGPGSMRSECGTQHTVFTNNMRRDVDVSVTLQNDGGCEIYLLAYNPLSTSPAPQITLGPVKSGSQAFAVTLPSTWVVAVACRGANDTRCWFQWRVDQVN